MKWVLTIVGATLLCACASMSAVQKRAEEIDKVAEMQLSINDDALADGEITIEEWGAERERITGERSESLEALAEEGGELVGSEATEWLLWIAALLFGAPAAAGGVVLHRRTRRKTTPL